MAGDVLCRSHDIRSVDGAARRLLSADGVARSGSRAGGRSRNGAAAATGWQRLRVELCCVVTGAVHPSGA